jgi:hypothetical protein
VSALDHGWQRPWFYPFKTGFLIGHSPVDSRIDNRLDRGYLEADFGTSPGCRAKLITSIVTRRVTAKIVNAKGLSFELAK